MLPNHSLFLAAIVEHKKVWLRFYSTADSGVLDRVCAPMDYGPGEIQDGLHRYWVWDYTSETESHVMGLLPKQIVELRVLGEVFDPSQCLMRPTPAAAVTPAVVAPSSPVVPPDAATVPTP